MAIYRGFGGAGDATDDVTVNTVATLTNAAAASETAAAASAAEAASIASDADASATASATSASESASSASASATSATAAAASATAANTSAVNAENSKLSAQDANDSALAAAVNAAASETAAAASETAAADSEVAAASSATAAALSASNAATFATNALSSANAASSSAATASNAATTATTAATSASASAAAAAASFDAFDDIYLGAKSANPSVDNDGNPLIIGALYFNTVDSEQRVWNGSTWQAASVIGGTVTNLTITNNPTLSAGTANGVTYLNGSKVLTSGSALTFDGTNLGIGTSSPDAKLDVESAATDHLRLTRTSAGYWDFGVGSSSDLIIKLSGTERMRIDSSGNVGIGTSSPGRTLHVAGSSVVATTADDAALLIIPSTARNTIYSRDGNFSTGTKPLAFFMGNVEAMRIDSSGNLGLGVTPSAWNSARDAFDIGRSSSFASNNTGDALHLFQNAYLNASAQYIYKQSTYATWYEQVSGQHAWYTAPSGTAGTAITFTQAMTLDASGNLGIGTSSPVTPLHVSHSVSGANYALRLHNTSTTTGSRSGLSMQVSNGTGGGTLYVDSAVSGDSPYDLHLVASQGGASLVFGSGGQAEQARIDDSGNLGLGVTPYAWGSTFKAFDYNTIGSVAASSTSVQQLYNTYFDGTNYIYKTSSIASRYSMGSSGVHAWFNAPSGTAGTAISFTQAMTLDSSGNLLVGTTTSPSNTATIAVPAGIYVGGTAAANHFGSYEEGTWTPVVADAASGGVTGTATVSYANYRKYGAVVTVTATLANITTTGMTAANVLYIRGLPFTSSSTNSSFGAVLTDTVTFQGSRTYLVCQVAQSDTWITLACSVSAGSDTNIDVSDITSGTSDIFITITYFTA